MENTNWQEYADYYLAMIRQGQREQAYHALLEADPAVLPFLVQAISTEKDPRIRALLLHIIWQHRQSDTIPVLIAALHDHEPEVWQTALDGLVSIGGPAVLAALQGVQRPEIKEWLVEATEMVTLEYKLGDLATGWRRTHSQGQYDEAALIVQAYHETIARLWQLGWRGDGLLPDEELPDELMPTYFIQRWKN